MSKKVFLNQEGKTGLINGINIIGSAVASTLGPTGKSVIIRKEYESPVITKDGVTVANSVESDDPVEQIAILMVRQNANNMDSQSGDGTTSTTVLCRSILLIGMEDLKENPNLDMISYFIGIKTVFDNCIDFIKENTKSITIADTKELTEIATISANNDFVLGKIISEAVQKAGTYGHVNIRDSNNFETRIDVLEGFFFDLGYADLSFANNKEDATFTSQRAAILLKNDKLIEKREWKDIMNSWNNMAGDPDLVIIAKDYSMEIVAMAKYFNSNHPNRRICLVRNMMRDAEFLSIYDDISAFTGAKITEVFSFQDEFGSAQDIVIKQGATIFGKTNVDFSDHVESLKKRIDSEKSDTVKNAIKQRIGKFENGIVTVFVGGQSDIEIKEKKDRAVDSYNSCKAAIKGGIVIGGGHLLYKFACSQNLENESRRSLGKKNAFESLKSIFLQICANSNQENMEDFKEFAKHGEYSGIDFRFPKKSQNLLKEGIIDPADTVINAILNSYSVASTILNTECVII